MKALTLLNPWGWAILHAGKPVENRTWFTSYRGPLLIHAGKGHDPHAAPFLRDLGVTLPQHIHTSAIVGLVNLVDVCKATVGQPHALCNCGRWAAHGQHHWRLTNPRPFGQPIPCRGRLGLWTPTPELAAAIEREVTTCASS